jgi:hypothetical protein
MLHLLLALQLAAQLVPPPAHCVSYREWAYNGITYHASIRIDGTAPVYKLHNGRYWSIDVAPGTHRIYADRLQHARTYQLDTGATYYFHVEIRMNPPPTFHAAPFQIVPVDPSIATAEMAPLRPAN